MNLTKEELMEAVDEFLSQPDEVIFADNPDGPKFFQGVMEIDDTLYGDGWEGEEFECLNKSKS